MQTSMLPTAEAVSLALLLLTACTTPGTGTQNEADDPTAAWWYEIAFEPISTAVKGIPVNRFDPTWASASTLDDSQLSDRIPKGGLAQYGDFSFELRADLDEDGGHEDIFVGVFETDSGSRGRFLAITRDGALLQHFQYRGEAGFSALMARTDEVRWYMCMECSEYESLRWSGQSYVLE